MECLQKQHHGGDGGGKTKKNAYSFPADAMRASGANNMDVDR
jgi:hypothetical protein